MHIRFCPARGTNAPGSASLLKSENENVSREQDGTISVGKSERAKRDERIESKRQTAQEKAPPIDQIQGPPWNAAVLAYLEAIDARLERIEDELGIES